MYILLRVVDKTFRFEKEQLEKTTLQVPLDFSKAKKNICISMEPKIYFAWLNFLQLNSHTDKNTNIGIYDIKAKEDTGIGSLKIKDEVNLELALRMGDRLGGHIVQGHSNGKSIIKKIDQTGKNFLLSLSITEKTAPYIVQEGSITIDGISLTISSVSEQEETFSVSIIPHTWENTMGI